MCFPYACYRLGCSSPPVVCLLDYGVIMLLFRMLEEFLHWHLPISLSLDLPQHRSRVSCRFQGPGRQKGGLSGSPQHSSSASYLAPRTSPDAPAQEHVFLLGSKDLADKEAGSPDSPSMGAWFLTGFQGFRRQKGGLSGSPQHRSSHTPVINLSDVSN